MTTTTPDAVEALAAAQRACWVYGTTETSLLDLAAQTIKSLSELGFTITRAEAPVADEKLRLACSAWHELPDDEDDLVDWCFQHADNLVNHVEPTLTTRAEPAMSEAELEATAKTIATMAFSVSDVRLIDVIARDIAELAKKYRGS